MTIEKAAQLAWKEMNLYGLVNKGWTLSFRPWRRIGGRCLRPEKIIALSAPNIRLNGKKGVLEIVRHEIAHALTDGNHTTVWKNVFCAIGGSGEVHLSRAPDIGIKFVQPSYIYSCKQGCQGSGCSYVTWRRSTRPRKCGLCGGRLTEFKL